MSPMAIRKLAKTAPKENWSLWLQSPQADRLTQATEGKASEAFLAKYPNADNSKFVAQTDFDENRKATAEICYKEGPGSLKSVFGSDSKYWPMEMRNALWILWVYRLSDRAENDPKEQIGETSLIKVQKIYITPTYFFTTQYRQIFKDSQITFRTSKNSRKWLGGPHMGFWPQQLNFALWCATTGCGISREILAGPLLAGNSQLRSFYLFHVYFTTKRWADSIRIRIRISSLPDDPNFSQTDNKYDEASYRRLCAEFRVDPSSDFRFNHGHNHGLGYIFINYSDGDFSQKQCQYPMPLSAKPSSQRFSDEGGTEVVRGWVMGHTIDFCIPLGPLEPIRSQSIN